MISIVYIDCAKENIIFWWLTPEMNSVHFNALLFGFIKVPDDFIGLKKNQNEHKLKHWNCSSWQKQRVLTLCFEIFQ